MANSPQRLLIVTQAVDADDPILGFFHRWLEEFAKHCESVTVICLKEGRHRLPGNVSVNSLGKERAGTGFQVPGFRKIRYAFRFLRYAWKLRKKYDAVLVHMNPEYLVVAGWLWRLSRKRVGLWYTHGAVSAALRIATRFANTIFTASPDSFRIVSPKVRVVGHGIDTKFFAPDPSVPRGEHWLAAGRLMNVKKHDLAIRAAHAAGVSLRIVGEGPERERLETLAKELRARVVFTGPLAQKALVREYQTARAFIHTSETGSMDKVVLEALACGCPVFTTSRAYEGLPVQYVAAGYRAIAQAVARHNDAEYVSAIREKHSLASLIPRILHEL